MTTTPPTIKRLSERNRKQIAKLLGEVSTLAELRDLLVEDDALLRNTEGIEVPDDAEFVEKNGIGEGDEVVM